MSQYLSVPEFTLLCILPQIGIDEIEANYPGWLDATLTSYSGTIDSRLKKRYVAPFEAPYPEQVRQWLVRLVDPRAYLKRGVDISDAQIDLLIKDADAVLVELKEAADAEKGLYELPLRADLPNSSGITKPGVLSTSQASPYAWMAQQAQRVSNGR